MPSILTGDPPVLQPDLWLIFVAVVAVSAAVAGVALGAWLMARLRVLRDRSHRRARSARGRRGEERAEALLEAAGYVIVARQQRASYALLSEGSELRVALSFDFVVAKDGQRWVAEVKTGALGTQLKHAETRRQLLEYQLASGGAQVLLVDPEHNKISEVRFPWSSAAPQLPRKTPWILAFAALALAGVLGVYLLLR